MALARSFSPTRARTSKKEKSFLRGAAVLIAIVYFKCESVFTIFLRSSSEKIVFVREGVDGLLLTIKAREVVTK